MKLIVLILWYCQDICTRFFTFPWDDQGLPSHPEIHKKSQQDVLSQVLMVVSGKGCLFVVMLPVTKWVCDCFPFELHLEIVSNFPVIFTVHASISLQKHTFVISAILSTKCKVQFNSFIYIYLRRFLIFWYNK